MENVGLLTKFHSNRHYISEIAIEGKRTSRFYFQVAYYDQYIMQVMRAGNALTLLTDTFELTRDNFWNTHYFEDISRFIFWTFNKSFLLALEEKITSLPLATVSRCIQLLKENSAPYQLPSSEFADQELRWCTVKNGHLQNNPNVKRMYELDKENRAVLLEALEKREGFLKEIADEKKINGTVPTSLTASGDTNFLEMLEPLNGSAEQTLQFLISQSGAAGFDYDIFTRVSKLSNGKNPYGLNSTIGAVIDYFYQLGYFKKAYSMEDILKTYFSYSGNNIGKLKVFLSEFRQDKNYQKNIAKLKLLKISKL